MPEIAIAQGTIRYRDTGEGPPVVFVHGLLVDGTLWRKVTPLLEGDARCIAPDLPLGSHRVALGLDGGAATPAGIARLVGDLLAALDLDDVTLVGNDTGGVVSQLVALDHGERVGRLVLTNCDCFEVFPPTAFKPMVQAAKVPGALYAALQPLRTAAGRRLATTLPNARLEPIAGAHTFVAEDEPEALADLIRGFVRERVLQAA